VALQAAHARSLEEHLGISEAKSLTFTSSQSEPAKPTEIRFIPVLDAPAAIAVEPAAKRKKKSKAKGKAKKAKK
jgi:hypothetical protein